MHVAYTPDFPVTDVACKAATGRSFADWYALIDGAGLATNRRDAIQLVYNETGRGKDVWWPTTIWVEFERARGIVKKDGRAEGYNICCTKGFKLAPADLFPHFATQEALGAWVTGWTGEVTEGGRFRCGDASGTVGRIRANKDIRLDWQGPGFSPTEIEIQFTVLGDKTTINIFHKRIATRAEADGLRRAWGVALDHLKRRVG